ncbi:MAG: hypothetical protein KJ638_04000 [Chloroflexi bacterium]|nr:hypothetical protein [Chloroflexota bacterium]
MILAELADFVSPHVRAWSVYGGVHILDFAQVEVYLGNRDDFRVAIFGVEGHLPSVDAYKGSVDVRLSRGADHFHEGVKRRAEGRTDVRQRFLVYPIWPRKVSSTPESPSQPAPDTHSGGPPMMNWAKLRG